MDLRRFIISLSACCSLALLAAGCSNGSRTGAFAPQAPGFPTDRTAFAPAALGGIVNTKTFSVPAGKTVTVSRDLAVFASAGITIAGTMKVPRGVSVAFFTPAFTIASSGSIVPVPNAHYPGPTHDLVSACQIDVANLWEVGAGDSLGITSSLKRKAKPGHPCTEIFALRNLSGNDSSILLDPGVPGGSDPHRNIGQNGGWIVIGSPQAISVTQSLAKKDGHATLRAFAPDVLTIDSLLAAGNGGKGQSDDAGTGGTGGFDFSPSAGGIGGSVQISAGKIDGTLAHVAAGNGGDGGDLGFGFANEEPYPLDGSETSADAVSATLSMASGGGGGGIFIVAKTPKGIWERAGDGGNPSELGINGSFYAGYGWPQVAVPFDAPASGSSVGGSLTLELALPGSKGPHGNNKPNKPKNGTYSAMQFYGGWGSAWINPNVNPSPPPGTAAQGGKGGSLTFVPPPHIAIDKLRTYKLKIYVFNFGNGGTSVLLCGGVPAVAGLNGGDAGALHDNGLFSYLKGTPLGFTGGQGSNGTPPGSGGQGGKNDEGTAIGTQGAPGTTTC